MDVKSNSSSTMLLLNEFLKEYGEIKSLSIDREAQSIHLSIHPIGEKAWIDIKLLKYELLDDCCSIKICRASADVQWLNNLLKNLIVGKSIPLPAELYSKLAVFL